MKKMMTDESSAKNNSTTVVVGLSGGVDSSVVALLLKNQGYHVVGLHMKTENAETSAEDESRVRKLCEKLGIECHVVNYADEMQKVKDYFVQEYLSGRTPNPCVVCNREVKFKPFIDYAEKIGADFFATGHYARVLHENDSHVLLTAADSNKDQTYFLCKLSEKQLSKALFPLGGLTKPEVKQIAEQNDLVPKDQKESYDVCFLGSQKFKDFMNQNYPEKSGDIVDEKTNKKVGSHTCISKYTIGQRKGLGIGGGHGESGECWFVTKKDIKNNVLYVAQGNDDVLYSDALISHDFNWIPSKPNKTVLECYAKFRYRQGYQKVLVELNDAGDVFVKFYEKQRAVTTGQYVVLYSAYGNSYTCLGGGTIDEVIKNS